MVLHFVYFLFTVLYCIVLPLNFNHNYSIFLRVSHISRLIYLINFDTSLFATSNCSVGETINQFHLSMETKNYKYILLFF